MTALELIFGFQVIFYAHFHLQSYSSISACWQGLAPTAANSLYYVREDSHLTATFTLDKMEYSSGNYEVTVAAISLLTIGLVLISFLTYLLHNMLGVKLLFTPGHRL